MRRKRAQKIKNENFPVGDPRRWEPGVSSIKRMGANWRERWRKTLKLRSEPVGQMLTDAYPEGMWIYPRSL